MRLAVISSARTPRVLNSYEKTDGAPGASSGQQVSEFLTRPFSGARVSAMFSTIGWYIGVGIGLLVFLVAAVLTVFRLFFMVTGLSVMAWIRTQQFFAKHKHPH
jgi:hypothetical protein